MYITSSFSYFVNLYLQLLVFCFVITNTNGRSPCFAKYQNGTLGNETQGTVSVRQEDIYAFDYKGNLNNDQVYLEQLNNIRLNYESDMIVGIMKNSYPSELAHVGDI